jgi:hypothetical protein
MIIIPHSLYSPDLAPCDFVLFPKLKMKLKGQHFEKLSASIGNCKWYLTALRKMTSTVLLKRGKYNGLTVFAPKETILKTMAAKI